MTHELVLHVMLAIIALMLACVYFRLRRIHQVAQNLLDVQKNIIRSTYE